MAAASLQAQSQDYTYRTQSNLVLLPTHVQTQHGETIYGLKPEQFVVEDNGVRQRVRVDEDTDLAGLSLVVAVQCSRSAGVEFSKFKGLQSMIEGIAGDGPHEVPSLVMAMGQESWETFPVIRRLCSWRYQSCSPVMTLGPRPSIR